MYLSYEQLREKLAAGDKYDLAVIDRAYQLAYDAHGEQKRRSGEPYITHPVQVAALLWELGMDTDCVVAALLHDVVEDTPTSLDEVSKQFGPDVALLVDGVTKLGKIQFTTKEDEQAENIRKMLLAMSKDIRVILIKLCDRLHNMRTLEVMPEQHRRDKALEVMEVYAPIAHRLGISSVKEELEDLALKYLDPFGYYQIQEYLNSRKVDTEDFLEIVTGRIRERLKDYEDVIEISGRVKSIYGIYRKVFMSGRSFDEIYDIVAVRILCNTVNECYNILGLMHDLFRPIPNRFKDYISTPKPNMYQSLHTTVISKEKMPFEIQIRTYEMHHTAEYGIAAHWKYKAGVRGSDKLDEKLAWVRQLLEAQKDSEDARDIITNIKSDLTFEEVYAFTPKGDVKSLPKGSTVIDFAYAIHSGVGNSMVGAKVDGRIVSLDYQIQNGEIIEIITTKSPNRGPSRDWLKIVHTSEARNKIRNWFKKTQREENILEGKIEVDREFKRNQIAVNDEQLEQLLMGVGKKYQVGSLDDFYAALGYGGINLTRLMPRIKEAYSKMVNPALPPAPLTKEEVPLTKSKHTSSGGVEVEGIDNCLVKFAKCCNPLPGDSIVGFITRGFGVSVHKADCPNVLAAKNLEENSERWVKVKWSASSRDSFKSTLQLVGLDRQGLFADISIALSAMRVPIFAINARSLQNGFADVMITIGISNVEHLTSIIARLQKIQGVESVQRSSQ
ncbi:MULTISPECIES: RelA/SpoT family protein [Eubacteriales]|uniref:GTP diphosphokinase n=1 Tax=Bittarella massiliensis (ex Durand et al. 2017) TaxID=1720313 RepID=A0AAQ1MCG3_9FIRM|nr:MULTISPECIES: bifunctional (p)ppGpp synthetase/guanosine-3',5'-bis(diphosphate) 3'-pyrophosphohydrolase [Eubacteriales]ERI96946.1 putative GTP diphosphokinase [Clostridium sp. ATCC 29733]MZL68405.1 RelA/SpoT family protein [Bittarella massiliensis (ex Durand et al. 2017)]MZL79540.1 RelA/SpoT family protein [Bittarella massiliensis (ex Durand et al. 2017)]SHF87355.1 GTP pyrophosphokinase [Bittarella massiliensis (ex Durand et al. 2017)]